MTGKTTGATGAMTGKTTGATGAMTGKTVAAAGPGCSGSREQTIKPIARAGVDRPQQTEGTWL
jgi:hypothetical protein